MDDRNESVSLLRFAYGFQGLNSIAIAAEALPQSGTVTVFLGRRKTGKTSICARIAWIAQMMDRRQVLSLLGGVESFVFRTEHDTGGGGFEKHGRAVIVREEEIELSEILGSSIVAARATQEDGSILVGPRWIPDLFLVDIGPNEVEIDFHRLKLAAQAMGVAVVLGMQTARSEQLDCADVIFALERKQDPICIMATIQKAPFTTNGATRLPELR